MKPLQYKFYATILDSFQNYISSSEIYQQYYGFSENPKLTEDEFEKEQFQSLIDRINRVPFESEAADKGTAFNEVIDCIIENRQSDKIQVKREYFKKVYGDVIGGYGDRWAEVVTTNKIKNLIVTYNNREFSFPYKLTIEISNQLKGALTQQHVEGILETKYGNVLLYGYLDQLMPFRIVDLKTTKQYKAFKYRKNWQHKVYPFCLNQNNVFINEFEYKITDFRKVYSEIYMCDKEKDLTALKNHCEAFIEFLEANKHLITDRKIFAQEQLKEAIG